MKRPPRTKWKKSKVTAYAVRDWRGVRKGEIRNSKKEIQAAYKTVYNRNFSARRGLKIVEVEVREK
jgi:hypothetical protein